MRRLVFVLVGLLFAGCLAVPKAAVGIYDAPNGEFIVIKRDGSLYWSPLSKTSNQLTFVGILPSRDNLVSGVALIVPSSSPYLYSSVQFNPTLNCIKIDWGSDFRGRKIERSTEFNKRK